jgi:hypothetical protein
MSKPRYYDDLTGFYSTGSRGLSDTEMRVELARLERRGDRAVALLRMVRDGYRQGASAEVDAFLAEEDAR